MVLDWSLILYLSKGIHVGQLQWDSTRKVMTVLKNLYGVGTLGRGDTMYEQYGIFFTDKS